MAAAVVVALENYIPYGPSPGVGQDVCVAREMAGARYNGDILIEAVPGEFFFPAYVR